MIENDERTEVQKAEDKLYSYLDHYGADKRVAYLISELIDAKLDVLRRSRESSDELAALAAKYLGMEAAELYRLVERDAHSEPRANDVFDDIKRLAGSVVSQARGDK